jgi:oligopeptide transport system substrate-binding protein
MVKIGEVLSRQWLDNLGIEVAFEPKNAYELAMLKAQEAQFHHILMGWMFDYPDPDNILCQQNAFLNAARLWGWHDETYLELVKEAGRTANQKKRMEMYRQADHMLVQDQVLVLPLIYSGSQSNVLVKPWVNNLQITPTGRIIIKNILMEDH